MPVVLDASVCGCWLLPDEDDPVASTAYKILKTDTGHVPPIWWYEIRNILIMNERRGRISRLQADHALSVLQRMTIYIDHTAVEATVLDLARNYRLSVYDAAYLELASRRVVPLATLDRALQSAAQKEGVTLVTG